MRKIRRERGVALIMALFLVVLLLMVAIAVLTNANNSATDTFSIESKNQAFDAAEAGLHTAWYQINENNAITAGTPYNGTGTVNGYSFSWGIVKNNLTGLSPGSVGDPANPNFTVSVPVGQAYLIGSASAIPSGRTVYSEMIVKPGPPTQPVKGAITCGGTAQVSHQQINDPSGSFGANIYCGNITTSGGGQIPQGNTYTVCATAGCDAITGHDGTVHTGWPAPSFLSSGQIAAYQNQTLTNSKTGANVYINANVTSSATWGTSGSSCWVYVNGNITLSGNATVTNYCPNTVVTGNVTTGGNSRYISSVPSGTAQMLMVLGSGGAIFGGTPTNVGFVYAANGSITFNGSGNASYSGAVVTPYNVTMNGGGTSVFNFIPPSGVCAACNSPVVKPVAQWEY